MRLRHIAFAFGTMIAALSVTHVVEAGTCQPVKAKGKASDLKTATALAEADLKQKAKAIGGKVTQTSSNCVPGPSAVVCKIDAVVCPK